MRGMPCPACDGRLVSFGRFFCEVDVNTEVTCGACGSTLRCGRATFAVLGALALCLALAAMAVVRATLGDPTGTSLAALALFFIVAPPAFLLLGKFIAWKLVPWKPVEQVADDPRSRPARN